MCNWAGGKTVFQTSWLTDERFKMSLKAEKKSNEVLWCLCSGAVINVANIGVGAFFFHE